MYVLIENNGVSLGHWVSGNFPSASGRGPAGSNDLSYDSVLIMILPDALSSKQFSDNYTAEGNLPAWQFIGVDIDSGIYYRPCR